MRRLLQKILLKPILWASNKFASRPLRDRIFPALSELYKNIREEPGKKGIVLTVKEKSRYIVFSDQHRGARNGADDFANAEPNYLAALNYYFENKFQFISLGDSEELWENSLSKVKKNNTATFEAEKKFINENRFFKIFGNHDLYWANDPLAWIQIKAIFGKKIKVFEGIILQWSGGSRKSTASNNQLEDLQEADGKFEVFLTHGHQGDIASDGNWFSKFFVSNIWAPLQAYLRINPNTPAYDEEKKTEHNNIMYEWSARQKELILITGHTHQPVFESLTHLERIYKQLSIAISDKKTDEIVAMEAELKRRRREYKSVSDQYIKMKPSYFNSGCCCFVDGDCTGIEITYNKISLIKWSSEKRREVLEEVELSELLPLLQ